MWVIFFNDIHHCEHNFASSGFMLVNYMGCKTRVRAPCGHVWIVTGKSCKTRNLTEKYIFRWDTMKPDNTVTDMFISCQKKKKKIVMHIFIDMWHLRDAVVTMWDAKVIAQSLRQNDMDLSLPIFQTIKYDPYYFGDSPIIIIHWIIIDTILHLLAIYLICFRICNFPSWRKSNILVRHVVVVGM